jgi:hypothetical protein
LDGDFGTDYYAVPCISIIGRFQGLAVPDESGLVGATNATSWYRLVATARLQDPYLLLLGAAQGHCPEVAKGSTRLGYRLSVVM